jgi:hypothetical protein
VADARGGPPTRLQRHAAAPPGALRAARAGPPQVRAAGRRMLTPAPTHSTSSCGRYGRGAPDVRDRLWRPRQLRSAREARRGGGRRRCTGCWEPGFRGGRGGGWAVAQARAGDGGLRPGGRPLERRWWRRRRRRRCGLCTRSQGQAVRQTGRERKDRQKQRLRDDGWRPALRRIYYYARAHASLMTHPLN